MPKFRKKPVVIEAMQVTKPLPDGFVEFLQKGSKDRHVTFDMDREEIVVDTLEGKMTARLGDWIIKGVQNELYPCKPDIFEATYEPA